MNESQLMAERRANASPYKVGQRRKAAEEVCWALLLMMEFGGLEIPMGWRDFLSKDYNKWAKLAVETGTMRSGEDDPK